MKSFATALTLAGAVSAIPMVEKRAAINDGKIHKFRIFSHSAVSN